MSLIMYRSARFRALKIIYDIIGNMWDVIRKTDCGDKIYLYSKTIHQDEYNNIMKRFSYYCPNKTLVKTESLRSIISKRQILLFNTTPLSETLRTIIKAVDRNIYFINFKENPNDGWEWIRLLNTNRYDPVLYNNSKERFRHIISQCKKQKLNKCYLFGTGPSLENARNANFSDGYRVVCNTIGKDKELWDWINPHFIVAGDAIYHFGHTTYAKKFRSDLLKRLKESEAYFIYPMEYHPIVIREFIEVENKLLPIPIKHALKFNDNLTSEYSLPWIGNVFGLLLLPVGCTLSKNIFLWGFDGRAPDDVLFWKNSNKHSYSEDIEELQKEHPMFYEARVPSSNPTKYVKDVFGDELEQILTHLEKDGTHITMMHHSWTPCFQKRYIQDRDG